MDIDVKDAVMNGFQEMNIFPEFVQVVKVRIGIYLEDYQERKGKN